MSNMATIFCAVCHVEFAIPESMERRRREDGKDFYCPNGHCNVFNGGKSKADKLAEELSRARQQLAQKTDELRDEAGRRQKAEMEAQSLKRRTAAGVCPCCSRTFKQLAAHMKSKHPGVVSIARQK
jgi:hypothetical protein